MIDVRQFVAVVVFLIALVQCHQNHGQASFQQAAGNVGGHQQQQQLNQPHPGGNHPNHQQNQMMNNINKDHVLDHLDGVINKPKEQMTPDEQNFYYFKLHDYDNNNMLDGLELVSAFAHNDGKALIYTLSF